MNKKTHKKIKLKKNIYRKLISLVLNIGNNKPIKLMKYIKQIELNLKKKAKENSYLQKGDIKKTLSDSSLLEK